MAACVSQRQLPAAAGRDRQQGRRRHPAASCACSAACDSAHLLLTLRRHLALLLLRLRHLRLKLPAHGQERHPSVLVRGLAARRQLVALCAQMPGQWPQTRRARSRIHTQTHLHTRIHTHSTHTHTHTPYIIPSSPARSTRTPCPPPPGPPRSSASSWPTSRSFRNEMDA